MAFAFRKHYTREEARALLPQIRGWFNQLTQLRKDFEKVEKRSSQRLAEGSDLGGESTNQWVKILCAIKVILTEFEQREIQIKDLARGLIDFPAIIGGREVFLCWEREDDDIEYWHELDAGYAGREKL